MNNYVNKNKDKSNDKSCIHDQMHKNDGTIMRINYYKYKISYFYGVTN